MNIAFLFPGQGAQSVGMCGDLIKAYPSIGDRVSMGSEILGIDLHALLRRGPPRDLAQTHVAQVGIFCLSYGIYEILQRHGFVPAIMAGHSLGQFSALASAQAVTFDAGLQLVAARGKYMHEINASLDGGMLAVSGLGIENVEEILAQSGESVWIANQNAPSQYVLAGLRDGLRRVAERVVEVSGRATWLDVAGPYHTPLLRHAANSFSVAIESTAVNHARIPVIANTTAQIMQDSDQITHEMHRHMLSQVDWVGTLRTLRQQNIDACVEVGPGKVLKGLLLRNMPEMKCFTTGSVGELEQACAAFSEMPA